MRKKWQVTAVGFFVAFLLFLFTATSEDYSSLDEGQWGVEKLKQAGDLSKYEKAWPTISKEHELGGVDLTNGATEYTDGKLTNGDVTLDLSNPGLKGAKIVALSGGGFSISKGTAENFEYEGNEINFGESKGNVEVKPNGEVILPNGAILKDDAGNIITALRDGLTVNKEGSTTIIKGVGKVETSAGVGYVGLGEKDGTLKLTPSPCGGTACFKFKEGNNYLIEPSAAGTLISEDMSINGLKVPVLDEEMRKNLEELSTKALQSESLERPEVKIRKELTSHFPEPLATELSSKLADDQRALTSLGGHTSTFSLVKSGGGVTLKPHLSGIVPAPVEMESAEAPNTLIEGIKDVKSDLNYFTFSPDGSFEAKFSSGYGQIVRMEGNIDGSKIRAIYEKSIPKGLSEAIGEKSLKFRVIVQTGPKGIEEGVSGAITIGGG